MSDSRCTWCKVACRVRAIGNSECFLFKSKRGEGRLNNYCKQAHRQASPLSVVVVLVQYLGTVGGKIEEVGERFTSKVRVRESGHEHHDASKREGTSRHTRTVWQNTQTNAVTARRKPSH